ncbi:hypothetical protein CBM2625_U10044 [Cupriavidus taiwanensis]|nr:hypothetical protein CBM2625_U10044 [Cupriavidus taiwanensis]
MRATTHSYDWALGCIGRLPGIERHHCDSRMENDPAVDSEDGDRLSRCNARGCALSRYVFCGLIDRCSGMRPPNSRVTGV